MPIIPMFDPCGLLCAVGCGVPCAACVIEPIPGDEVLGTAMGIKNAITFGGICGGFM